jgi:D-sedoheptulose 7-phosphate isomerase
MNDLQQYFARLSELHIEASTGLTQLDLGAALRQSVILALRTKTHDKRVFFIGNGGSAAIASHMTTDWLKNGGFAALCFNDGPQLTCLSNDLGYARSFSVPLAMHVRSRDLVIAISSSGGSLNILTAVDAANKAGADVITLSGFDPYNPLRKAGCINFWVDAKRYGFVEIAHLTICHAILDHSMEKPL